MNNQLYFADEELKEVEKAVYEITFSHDNQWLDREFLLEKLFERGFNFEKYTKDKIKRIILNYLKNWLREELSNLQSLDTESHPRLKVKIENILILKEFLRLTTRSLSLFNTTITFAFNLIKEQRIKNLLIVMYEAIYCRSLKELEEKRQRAEIFKNWGKRKNAESLIEFLSRKKSETNEEISYKPPIIEEEENDEDLEEFKQSPYGKFSILVYVYIKELEEFPKEELKSLFEEQGINLEDITTSELIRTLFEIAEFEIEYIIDKDEYMSKKFFTGDFDAIENDCKDFEDIESKDCQLARLYYLWLLIQYGRPDADYKLFKFLEERIKFTNSEKNLIEFIKEQINLRHQREKEISALRIKKRRMRKRLSKK